MNFNCRECFSFHFWLIHDLQLLTPHAFLVFSVTLTSTSNFSEAIVNIQKKIEGRRVLKLCEKKARNVG